MTDKKGNTLHGILLIALFALSAFFIADFQWVKSLSLSPLIVGIILGMIYANTLRKYMPADWTPGIKLCTKQILRTGIVLYGFRLTIQDVLGIGLPALWVDSIVILGTIMLSLVFGRMLKMDRDTTLMTGTGAAICGAAAVLGAEPVVKCEPHKTAVAVSTVVIFGTLSMFIYPIVYRMGILDLNAEQWAIYTGGTLHEVAHVVGAGNAMDPQGTLHIADQATITKMIRVMMLAPVLLIMAVALAKRSSGDTAQRGKSKIAVPWFAFGFIGIIILNSVLQSCSFIPQDGLSTTVGYINSIDTFLLTMAMTALGTDTSIDKFKAAGAKPFVLALMIYVWLLVGGYALVKLFV
ncbi:MAG: YeiH family protein [Muribaculaceae bacterium]